ncbi:MAG: MltA domain-containing protein, partial [Pseudomonadota bacterium]
MKPIAKQGDLEAHMEVRTGSVAGFSKALLNVALTMPFAVTCVLGTTAVQAQQTYVCPNGDVIETSAKGSQEKRRITAIVSITEREVGFGELPGWRDNASTDSLMQVIQSNCKARDLPAGWQEVCTQTQHLKEQNLHRYIESKFVPFQLIADASEKGLFTAYYASYVDISRTKSADYSYPIYRVSPEAESLSRRDIERGALPETDVLFWADNAFDVYILHVQGSGVGRLPDGTKVNITYAGKNKDNYVSLGKVLRECGDLEPGEVSLPSIKAWVNQ